MHPAMNQFLLNGLTRTSPVSPPKKARLTLEKMLWYRDLVYVPINLLILRLCQ